MPDFLLHYGWLNGLSEWWWWAKDGMSRLAGVSHDWLHLLIGLLFFPLFVMVLRSTGHPRPRRDAWLLVLVLELGNEALDLALDLWPAADVARQIRGGLEDILITMLAPTMMIVAARLLVREKVAEPVAD